MLFENLEVILGTIVILVGVVWFQRMRAASHVIGTLDLSADEDIEISTMREDEFERALDIAANAFCTNNPVVSHLGLKVEEFKKFTRSEHSVECNVKSGLSLVARLKGQNKPMAFLFMSDFDLTSRTDEMDKLIEANPKLVVMREMTENIFELACMNAVLKGNGLCLGSMTSRTKTCWATLGGTFPGYEGRGLGKLLRKHAVEVARKLGYNSLLVEPIHGATRHIWTKYCRAEVMSQQNFDDFRSPSKILGECPTKGLKGNSTICQVLLRPSWIDVPLFAPFLIIRLLIQVGDIKLFRGGFGLVLFLVLLSPVVFFLYYYPQFAA